MIFDYEIKCILDSSIYEVNKKCNSLVNDTTYVQACLSTHVSRKLMKNTAKKRVGGGKNKNYIANNKNNIYGAKNEKKKIEYRDGSAN